MREAENTLRQFDRAIEVIESALARPEPLHFSPALVKDLHAIALDGLVDDAGEYRTGRVFITNSEHRPPESVEVPALVKEMCDRVRDRWRLDSAVSLAAYVMWRLNWIHPFADGNGRTSRAAGYIVLSCKLGFVLRGADTLAALINSSRRNYYDALVDSDMAWRGGRVDVSSLERMLQRNIARQLGGPTE